MACRPRGSGFSDGASTLGARSQMRERLSPGARRRSPSSPPPYSRAYLGRYFGGLPKTEQQARYRNRRAARKRLLRLPKILARRGYISPATGIHIAQIPQRVAIGDGSGRPSIIHRQTRYITNRKPNARGALPRSTHMDMGGSPDTLRKSRVCRYTIDLVAQKKSPYRHISLISHAHHLRYQARRCGRPETANRHA